LFVASGHSLELRWAVLGHNAVHSMNGSIRSSCKKAKQKQVRGEEMEIKKWRRSGKSRSTILEHNLIETKIGSVEHCFDGRGSA